MPKRFPVALEDDRGISGVGPDAYLEAEPHEDDEIELEDGTRARVKYLFTTGDGETAIAAKFLPRQE